MGGEGRWVSVRRTCVEDVRLESHSSIEDIETVFEMLLSAELVKYYLAEATSLRVK
jgi:hypothetical protein